MDKNPLLEAVKEAGRYAIFTAVSIFLTTLLDKVKAIENQEVLVLVLTLVLRFLDKWKHEYLKDRKAGKYFVSKSYGILPF